MLRICVNVYFSYRSEMEILKLLHVNVKALLVRTVLLLATTYYHLLYLPISLLHICGTPTGIFIYMHK